MSGVLKFSVITVCLNAAAHIAACLQSVLDQDYAEVEHVIIDGASTDGTQDIVRRLSGRVSKFVSEPDGGIYDAMNKGIGHATGDYILFLGADDFLLDPKVLADAAEFLERNRADVVYGGLEVRHPDGRATIFHPPPPEGALEFMICGCLPHQATFARRDVFERLGRFNTRYKVHADYEWFLRVLDAEAVDVRRTDRVISSFALGGQSSQLRKGQLEVFDIQNAFARYQRPEWVQRRLAAFQQQALDYRVTLEEKRDQAAVVSDLTPGAAMPHAVAPRPAAIEAPDLPVHFFTIVLNGEPFIRYHLEMLKKLPFRWHWHIVEGVASLVRDTAWSVASGGRIDASFHDQGRSNDGTSAYLDEIAAANPENITLYRKPLGEFWDGKLEMVSAPLLNVREPCLLWQIDADELWTAAQIGAMRAAFAANPERTAAYFWCDYYVGPRVAICTRYNYAQNPDQDWLRVWRYKPGDFWAAHEPPTLVRRAPKGAPVDLGKAAPFKQDETEALGAVFQHFAYVTAEQARFKERYYGYADAERLWRALQDAIGGGGPLRLGDYFPWVTDHTMVDAVERLGMSPIAVIDPSTRAWTFRGEDRAGRSKPDASRAAIVLDGVFFQHNQVSGIARVWRRLLEEWRASGFAQHVLVLDRAGTAPRMEGVRCRSIPAWDEHQTGADSIMLQGICDDVGAELFISSYYTAPITTPSVFVAHDFIPEVLESCGEEQIWREKRYALSHACQIVCVSESTRSDLARLFPHLSAGVDVIANAVADDFAPASPADVSAVREKLGLERPYFLLVGERMGYGGYKNTAQFFRAFQKWERRDGFEILCVGGAPAIEPEIRTLTKGVKIQRVALSDPDLCTAYTGAAALIYPSLCEGFGLPVLEAMASACPVVTTRESSLGEVAGEAALFVDPRDDASMLSALSLVVEGQQRERLIALGLKRARQFSWRASAARYEAVLGEVLKGLREGAIPNPPCLWRDFREEQRRNQTQILRALARVPQRHTQPHQLHSGLTSALARSALRSPAFAVRGVLMKVLPGWAMPAARRAWRVMMGVKA